MNRTACILILLTIFFAAPLTAKDEKLVVTGTVTDLKGKPVKGATVKAFLMGDFGDVRWDEADKVKGQPVGKKGEYRLELTKKGWFIIATAPGHVELVHTAHSIEGFGSAFRCEFGLPKAKQISGTVKDEKGKAIPGAKILATIEGFADQRIRRYPLPRDWFETVADEKGKFTFDRLSDLKYRLMVYADGKVTAYIHDIGAGKKDVKVVLRPGKVIKGRVVDADGKPVAGAQVTIKDARETVYGTWTDPGGRFVTGPLDPGKKYKVIVDPRGPGPKPYVAGKANAVVEDVVPGGEEITIQTK